MFRVSHHKNGLTVVTAEMPHMASVSLGICVGIGGRHEPAPICGVAHFIEHLLFKGTETRSAKQISQDIEGVGGYLNAFTTEEATCFYSKARHDKFGDLFDVLIDMFVRSKFDPVEIEKERGVIKEELAMYQDQPQQHVQELLNELLWPGQALGRPLTGTLQSLDHIRREDLLEFQRENYVSGNTVIAAAGNVEHELVLKAATRVAKLIPVGRKRAFEPAGNDQKAPAVRLLTKATEQTQLAMGIRTCSRHDERRYALRVLNTVLGENMSSRLFQVVREDHGLAYNIGTSLAYFDDVGVLNISAGVDTDRVKQTTKLIAREMKRLTEELVTTGELRRARDYIVGQIDLSLENTENMMTWMAENWLGYAKIVTPEEAKNRILEVKASEIRSVARQFFCPDRISVALVSPVAKEPGLAAVFRA